MGNVHSCVLSPVSYLAELSTRGEISTSKPQPACTAAQAYLKHCGTTALERSDEYLRLLPLGI